MCVVVICRQCVAEAPLVVGANREEVYARGGTEPALRAAAVRFVAGLDPIAGGTWLGVNALGVLVAVTNRSTKQRPPAPRSRGLLVRDLLACPSAVAVVESAVRELATGGCAGCNLICADVNEAFVVEAADAPRLVPLTPGIHIVTTGNVDDGADPRIRFGLDWFARAEARSVEHLLGSLTNYLATRTGPVPICLHDGARGTVSSTIVALTPRLDECRLFHAQGSPDRTPYVDRSELFAELAAVPGEAP